MIEQNHHWLTRRRARLAALCLILLLAWALRLHDLDGRSLWADEGWTMLLSRGPGLDDVVRTLAEDQHPPLFFMLFRVWRSAAGDTEFAARYLSVLISVLAVAGIYPLGRALFGPLVGVLAALLLALVDLHIDLAQEVRHYSLLTTLAVFSSGFYVRWWRRPTRGNRVGYVFSSLALLYTHYLGVFVLLVQGMHLLLTARPWRKLASGVLLLALVGLGFLPWLPVVIAQNSVRWDNPLYYQNALPNSAETFRAVRTALLGGNYALWGGLALLGLVTITYVWGGRAGLTRAGVRLNPWWPIAFPALWIALVVLISVMINARREFLTVRNFVIVVPPLVLLVAHGLANLERTARLFLVGLILVIGLTTVDARRNYPDWRAVTRNVTDNHLPGEPVLMDVWVGDFPVRYYIDRQMGEDTPRVSLREWRDAYGTQFLPHMLDYIRQQTAFWLIYWGDDPMDEYGQLIADAGFERTAALVVNHLGTPLYSYRYDRLTGPPLAQFGELFTLAGAAAPDTLAPGEPLQVALWWSARETPPLDYSVSVFLLNEAGSLVAQRDAPPLSGNPSTSTWVPGQIYFERRALDIPAGLSAGQYQLGVKVYWYGDQQPLPVTVDGAPAGTWLTLGTYQVVPSN